MNKAIYNFLSYIHSTVRIVLQCSAQPYTSFGQHFRLVIFCFIPILDLSVTVKTGDIPRDSSSWGQVTENGETGDVWSP